MVGASLGSSENQDWTMKKIIGENDDFRLNHTTAGYVFAEKVDGDDLGFRPRVWNKDDGA
ncbi:hypothetical protein DVH24_017537 [Malus domestica]|uniref:Uncharacterized protein n=1 Tax=Malus domestica TaxID=3750 RepID=A0A498KPE4_MALDO|nr:hypothetical protein DVH24_013221 [Malus domestica]RXI09688.1 hypothetical protein DVH24_017537 [Malus domestica]